MLDAKFVRMGGVRRRGVCVVLLAGKREGWREGEKAREADACAEA
jgi:hypothetical protein